MVRLKCSVYACDGLSKGRGLCHKHWERLMNNGDPLKTLLIKDHGEFCTINGCSNKYYCKNVCKRHYELFINPRSNKHYSIELQSAMSNVRKRDNNTCQWYGCGLTNREAPIHVHHIFPRSEYPELELVEEYMICYCGNHHGLWHRYRGDKCSSLILGGDLT